MSETSVTPVRRVHWHVPEELLSDIVSLLYSNTSTPLTAGLTAAVFLAGGLLYQTPLLHVGLWIGAMLLLYGGRYTITSLHKRNDARYSPRTWINILVGGVFLTGLAWGSAVVFLSPQGNIANHTFVAFVLGGMAAGAVGTYSAFPVAVYAFLVPVLTPVVIRFIAIGSVESIIMGVLTSVFAGAMYLTSRRMNESIKESLQLRHENRGLVAYLREAKEQAEHANRGLQEAILEANRQASIAKDANEAKSNFLANISHEMRTPLNHIIGLTNLVLDDDMNEDQRDLLQTSLGSAQNLLTLMNDILDFSRLESKKMHLSEAETNLRGLIDEIVSSMRYQAEEKELEFEVAIDDEVPPVVICDPLRLRQILVNLIDNAIKFTPKGLISLSVERDSHAGEHMMLLFSVVDSGSGVAEEMRESIFESFTQGDSSSTREHGGTGLGLAISRELVTMMNGRIWVEEADSGGAAFHFIIRAKASDYLNGSQEEE